MYKLITAKNWFEVCSSWIYYIKMCVITHSYQFPPIVSSFWLGGINMTQAMFIADWKWNERISRRQGSEILSLKSFSRCWIDYTKNFGPQVRWWVGSKSRGGNSIKYEISKGIKKYRVFQDGMINVNQNLQFSWFLLNYSKICSRDPSIELMILEEKSLFFSIPLNPIFLYY